MTPERLRKYLVDHPEFAVRRGLASSKALADYTQNLSGAEQQWFKYLVTADEKVRQDARRAGSVRSKAKTAAARKNGKKGGRPKGSTGKKVKA